MVSEPKTHSEDYYLQNFETVLQDVRSRYGDLLQPREQERAEAFFALPLTARRIYVRMLTRRGPWFRQDGLRYREIPDPAGALAALARDGFGSTGLADPAILEPLLRKGEIETLLDCWVVSRPKGCSREALGGLLLEAAANGPCRDALAAALPVASPLELDWVRLLFFLFFGNGEQDLTEFILADTGRIRYEAYALDPGGCLFQARADVDFLLALGQLRQDFQRAAGAGDLDRLGQITRELRETLPHPGVRQQRRLHGLLNDLGREWEQRGEPDQALGCYALSQRPPARERTVRLLAARSRSQAAALAVELAADPWDAGEGAFAGPFLHRLARHDNLAAAWVLTHPVPEPLPEIRLVLPKHPSGQVELAALAAAQADGWEGFHTENTLWRGLFGLALWEVLFAPVPGAFQHRFQSAPADLGGPEFQARRRELLDRRLGELAKPGVLARELLATAACKRGIANAFVNWPRLPPERLEAALGALPAAAGLSVIRTLASSPLAFGHGFPDLFLYRSDPSRCMLWEVKGPGDSLRPEQDRWLRHFLREGVDGRVVRVQYRPI